MAASAGLCPSHTPTRVNRPDSLQIGAGFPSTDELRLEGADAGAGTAEQTHDAGGGRSIRRKSPQDLAARTRGFADSSAEAKGPSRQVAQGIKLQHKRLCICFMKGMADRQA